MCFKRKSDAAGFLGLLFQKKKCTVRYRLSENLNHSIMETLKIKRALLSVSDKTGLDKFAKGLVAQGVQLISTGGTCRYLVELGLPVTEISDYTGAPELFDGRVKTLHPKVHGGLLQRRDLEEHQKQAQDNNIPTIDLVCVNLYPFEETVAKEGVTLAEAIEKIDIGENSLWLMKCTNQVFALW